MLAIKYGKVETREELATSSGIHSRTLEVWLMDSRGGAVEMLLTNKPKNKTFKIITPDIHEGLSQRVHDLNNPF